MSRLQAFIDILLALGLTLLGGVTASALGIVLAQRFGVPMLLVLALQGLLILAGLHVLLRYRRQAWHHLRLRPIAAGDITRGLLALGLVFLASSLLSLLLAQFSPDIVDVHQQRLAEVAGTLTGNLPLLMVAVVMLFVGFYEEVLARGFLLSRCQTLLGGTWGPVLVSSLLFGLGHAYQGWTGVVQTMAVGIVLARLALHWGSLWPVILAHAALNTLSLIALRAMS